MSGEDNACFFVFVYGDIRHTILKAIVYKLISFVASVIPNN